MKLNAWLRQNPSSSARLQVVERLAQELTSAHERGEPMSALDPEHVDVEGDGTCDISAARRGAPAPGYGAPERAEGAPPSPEADIYAAGAIAWEILAGRPYAPAPSHLAEAARDVPRELADAIMACLEQSPQWRPRDLSYIAQLAQQTLGQSAPQQAAPRPASSRSIKAVKPSSGRTSRPSASARTTASTRAASTLRTTTTEEPRSHVMLAGVAAVVVLAAGGAYFWLTRAKTSDATTAPPSTVAPAALTATTNPPPVTAPVTTQPNVAAAPPGSVAAVATPPPAVAPLAPPVTQATLAPARTMPTAPPASMARAVPPPLTQPYAPVEPPRQTMPAAPRQTLPPATMAAAPPAAPPPTVATGIPSGPALLSAVSPLAVRRPGKVVLDLRGSGLRPDLRAIVLPVKAQPRGISIVRGVCKSQELFQVLLDLDAEVSPGAYAIALADVNGQTKPLTFTVTK